MDNFRPVQSSIGRKVSLVNTKLGENGAGWDSDSYSDDDCDVDNGDHGDGDGNYGDSDDDGDNDDHDYHDDWGWSTAGWERAGPCGPGHTNHYNHNELDNNSGVNVIALFQESRRSHDSPIGIGSNGGLF